MAYEFRLPDIGEGVVEGEVVRWLVKEGDSLAEDQPMVEVMTDKATVEIGSPRAGRVAKRMFAEGERCPVGKVLITIDVERSRVRTPSANRGAPDGPRRRAEGGRGERPACAARPGKRRGERRGRAGHAGDAQAGARHRRRHPRGRRHRPRRAHHLRRRARRTAAGRPVGRAPRRRRRGTRAPTACGSRSAGCARRSPRSWSARSRPRRTSPTSRRSTAPSWSRCARKLNARRGSGEKLSFLPFIIKATIAALRKFPQMNAMLDEAAGEIIQWQQLPHRPGDGDGERAHRAGHPRRRRQVAGRAGARDRAAGRGDPHRQGRARGAHGLDVHHHQPGRARRRDGDRHHQPARGRHPGRAPDRRAGRRWSATRSSSATS